MNPFVLFAAGFVSIASLIFTPAGAQSRESVSSDTGKFSVETIAEGLSHPWGMALLPDGRLLVTEREGRLRILDQNQQHSAPIQGTPEVFAAGQGGLLDVALDPDFKSNGYVYLSFAEPDGNKASTALGRGRLQNDQLQDFQVIFRQEPKVNGSLHFGGRIVFSKDGHLYLSMGDRNKFDPAQDLSNHLGTIVRIRPDGSVPQDNPFVKEAGARPEIWSYGHRNVQGLAIHPQTGELWETEMGPRDGDELNLIEAGQNYGWPKVSWGNHYDGRKIPDPPTEPHLTDALTHWSPVISPSGMIFYTGNLFPGWQGSLLISGLSSQALVRVTINGREAEEVERVDLGARIRDVEQAPDGSLYLLTDDNDGQILRLTPEKPDPGTDRNKGSGDQSR